MGCASSFVHILGFVAREGQKTVEVGQLIMLLGHVTISQMCETIATATLIVTDQGKGSHFPTLPRFSVHVTVLDSDKFVEKVKEDAHELSHVSVRLIGKANIRIPSSRNCCEDKGVQGSVCLNNGSTSEEHANFKTSCIVFFLLVKCSK